MKDKELIENSRLRERTGGYHKFVDSAEVHNPDPTSSHFISGKYPEDYCPAIPSLLVVWQDVSLTTRC